MRILILILLLFGLTFSSCKKKDLEFKLNGNVTALNNGSNISDVDINVYVISLGNSYEKLVGTTKTDASGNYELSVERSKFEKLIIKVSKDNYFNVSKLYSFDALSTEKENKTNHIISPKSYTRFILKNNNSNPANDELKFFKLSGKSECEECCDNGFYYYYGALDTVVVCANDGDTYMKFYWWVNGNEQHGEDSIYNAAFQTIDFTISY